MEREAHNSRTWGWEEDASSSYKITRRTTSFAYCKIGVVLFNHIMSIVVLNIMYLDHEMVSLCAKNWWIQTAWGDKTTHAQWRTLNLAASLTQLHHRY